MPEIDGIELVKYLAIAGMRRENFGDQRVRAALSSTTPKRWVRRLALMSVTSDVEANRTSKARRVPKRSVIYSDDLEREEFGAGRGNRTLDTKLGKLVLYH